MVLVKSSRFMKSSGRRRAATSVCFSCAVCLFVGLSLSVWSDRIVRLSSSFSACSARSMVVWSVCVCVCVCVCVASVVSRLSVTGGGLDVSTSRPTPPKANRPRCSMYMLTGARGTGRTRSFRDAVALSSETARQGVPTLTSRRRARARSREELMSS